MRSWLASAVLAAAISVTSEFTVAQAACDMSDPCAARTCRIDAGIAQARAKGDTKALAKLERAKADMAKCSVDGLKQKRTMALEQAQKRMDLSSAELETAKASGDAAKIKNAQRKLDNARKVYADVEKSPL